jgi:hypothetical protein
MRGCARFFSRKCSVAVALVDKDAKTRAQRCAMALQHCAMAL